MEETHSYFSFVLRYNNIQTPSTQWHYHYTWFFCIVVSWLFNWLYDFHNTYQNLRFGGQYNEHFFASTIKIALWRLFETETTLEQGFPKYAQRMPTDPRPDLIHTCTHNFVGPQILSYNSRTWNLSEKNTLHTNKHNTINKCQYYSLQNQIMCII